MINRFREWMHGKGRTAVMIIVALIALCIILNYFLVERNGQWGNQPVASATPTPKPMEETVVGGDRLGAVREN